MPRFRIRQLIAEANARGHRVSQRQLADVAGITPPSMSQIVRGDTENPRIDILQAIADFFAEKLKQPMTIDDLIEHEGEEGRPTQRARHPAPPGALYLQVDDFVRVPELGKVPCGPLDKVDEEDIVDYHWIPKQWVEEGWYFLRAAGDSMAPKIEHNDLLLVEPGHDWRDQHIVVVRVNGEFTCKHLHLYNDHALLVALNPAHKPIVVTDEVVIVGRVRKIVKDT